MSTRGINNQQVYRIAYESFSKFSNNLNRCSSLEEVGEVIQKHLKYLFNFYFIKLSIQLEGKLFSFSIHGTTVEYDLKGTNHFFDFEKTVLANKIPFKTNTMPAEVQAAFLKDKNLENPQLWCWAFQKKERAIVVSLASDDHKPFAIGDIEILKLAVDNFDAKFQEIYLARQLDKKNQSLMDAYKTIQSKNAEISAIVEHQKEIIEERTREIVGKNKKLLEISVLNAHNVREPLTRILGLVELFNILDDTTCRNELIPKLDSSAKEMDEVLKKVIEMASKEIVDLKAKKL